MNSVAEPKNKVRRRFKNVESFEKWAYQQEFGYEFAHNKVIKKEMIKDVELMIIWWLTEFFKSTEAFKNRGNLVSEVGMKLKTESFRVPDLAFFTAEQHFSAAKGDLFAMDCEVALHLNEKLRIRKPDFIANGGTKHGRIAGAGE